MVIPLSRPAQERSSILLVLPLPVRYDKQGQLLIESQAANGLERWADNFESVTAACILTPESQLGVRSSWTWRPVHELPCADRAEVIPLPWAYRPSLFLHHYREIRKQLGSLIREGRLSLFWNLLFLGRLGGTGLPGGHSSAQALCGLDRPGRLPGHPL